MLIYKTQSAQRLHRDHREKDIIDADLAEFYGVTTKALNQAIRRNIERFPENFMFQLNKNEKNGGCHKL